MGVLVSACHQFSERISYEKNRIKQRLRPFCGAFRNLDYILYTPPCFSFMCNLVVFLLYKKDSETPNLYAC